MRWDYKELMEKLGIDRELMAYETQPWMFYDDDKQITCSAEVRVGPGMSDIEAEVQFLMDDDADYDDEDEDETGGRGVSSGIVYGPDEEPEVDDTPKEPVFPKLKPGGRQQLLIMKVLPSTEKWRVEGLKVKAKDYVNAIGGWEQKGCDVFTSCVQSINMGELPDIDALIEKELTEKGGGRGRRGRIGKKSPKVKPAALMGGGKPGGM